MLILNTIFISLAGLLLLTDSMEALPEWTQAEPTTNLFVVKTEEFSTNFAATESLLPAVKTDVTNWAVANLGEDSRSILDSIPIEEFRTLIEEELVHKFGRDYDAETAKRLEVDHDDFYVGYIRVRLHDSFRNQVQQRLGKLRLKNRLGITLVTTTFAIGSLAILWAYLFTSQLTRGLYFGRLRWIAGLLIGTLMLICYTVYQLIFWHG